MPSCIGPWPARPRTGPSAARPRSRAIAPQRPGAIHCQREALLHRPCREKRLAGWSVHAEQSPPPDPYPSSRIARIRPATISSRPSADQPLDPPRHLRRDAMAVHVPPWPRMAQEAPLLPPVQRLPQRLAMRPQSCRPPPASRPSPPAAAASATGPAPTLAGASSSSTGRRLMIAHGPAEPARAATGRRSARDARPRRGSARRRPWSGRCR